MPRGANRKDFSLMTWDGKERRSEGITIAEVKNAVYEANEEFFGKIKKMCDDNLKISLLEHTAEYAHFDKPTKTILYEIITNFKSRIKAKYSIGIPLVLLFAERILNKIGLF